HTRKGKAYGDVPMHVKSASQTQSGRGRPRPASYAPSRRAAPPLSAHGIASNCFHSQAAVIDWHTPPNVLTSRATTLRRLPEQFRRSDERKAWIHRRRQHQSQPREERRG